ncbi:MAG: hypothetical protein J3K34DRAFT_428865, partial [Monoraphidium minutum]
KSSYFGWGGAAAGRAHGRRCPLPPPGGMRGGVPSAPRRSAGLGGGARQCARLRLFAGPPPQRAGALVEHAHEAAAKGAPAAAVAGVGVVAADGRGADEAAEAAQVDRHRGLGDVRVVAAAKAAAIGAAVAAAVAAAVGGVVVGVVVVVPVMVGVMPVVVVIVPVVVVVVVIIVVVTTIAAGVAGDGGGGLHGGLALGGGGDGGALGGGHRLGGGLTQDALGRGGDAAGAERRAHGAAAQEAEDNQAAERDPHLVVVGC